MARKRMISPSMWESESFSELSDFSKLVFISLISHADDEGRGKAGPAFIKSITFPYDGDKKRVADIESALSQIARSMSVQFYSVDGREYYAMTNWLDYQKIDKPTKSKLPPPPFVGVGGDMPFTGNIGDNSGSSRGVVGESYPPNIIKDNIIKDNIHTNACARESVDLPDYDKLLQIVKEECPIVFNRHQTKVDSGNLQIAREVTQILEQLQGQYSYGQLREIFRKANKIFCIKPSYSSCDIKWVLNNIPRVLSEEENSKPVPARCKASNKGRGIIDGWQALHDKYANEEGGDDA